MGKSTVFANGQGISSKNSGAMSIGGPDVCLTPVGSSVVPIPYTNIAYSSDIADGTMTVKIDGGMGAVKDCCYAVSTGDEPGVALGIGSGTVAGKAEFINYSNDVFFEGRPVCRNSDAMTHNNKNALGVNQDSCSPPPEKEIGLEEVDPGTFRLKVVDHLSRDTYHEDRETYLLAHKDNRPITDKTFIITLPDGSKVEKTPDGNGIIEITGLEPGGKCDVEFKAEEAERNNNYYLFYDRITTIKRKL